MQLRSKLQRFGRQGWALLDRNNAVQDAIRITMPINQESSEDATKRVLPALQKAARGLRHLI